MGTCDCIKPKSQKFQRKENNYEQKELRKTLKYFEEQNKKNKDNLILNNDILITGKNEDPDKLYKKIKKLGKGAIGEIWQVKNQELGTDFAMKIIDRKSNSFSDKDILNEIEILKKLDHPNIVKISDFYLTKEKIYIITEYCPEGDLFKEIMEVEKFTEAEAAFILYQLLSTIRYCHKMRVIHRDIKPENIMINSRENNGCLQVKLIDFGTAKIFSKGNKIKKLVGSPYYIAPEVIKQKYNESCDIWSIGVVMYILLTGKTPFEGENDEEIIEAILKGDYDKNSSEYNSLSSQAKDLIKRLLTYNHEERITAGEALKHEWFKTTDFQDKNKINQIDPELAKKLIDNMTKYKSDNILKCAAIAYIVHNNTNLKPCIEASKLFNNIDINNDGKVEQEELVKGLVKFWNLPDDKAIIQAQVIFENLDSDHNGYIEHEEFIRAAINPRLFISKNYLRYAFKYFDTDESGDISFNDLLKKFTQSSNNDKNKIKKELQDLFIKYGINKNETINFDKFSLMFKDIMT